MTDLPRLYVTEKEAARVLGRSVDWLRKNAGTLERQFQFPKIDPATGLRHFPSIVKWAESRNDRTITKTQEDKHTGNENGF